MKKLPFLLLFALIALIQNHALGQPAYNVPWVNSDRKAENAGTDIITMNPFSGSGIISIPFYKYSYSGVDLSVGIKYDLSGIQVDRISSNIGLGWELHSGGSIERQVRGGYDNVHISYMQAGVPKGYWCTDYTDSEPDLFYADFGGRRLTFMFSHSGQLVTIPKTNVKIERYVNGNLMSGDFGNNDIKGDGTSFVITDESGNKFYFIEGQQEGHSEWCDPCQKTYDWYYCDKWVLDKVVPYNGGANAQVKYYYENSDINMLLGKSQIFRGLDANFAKIEDSIISKVYNTSRLLKIEYPNNIDVLFDYDKSTYRADLRDDYRMIKVTVKERNVLGGNNPQTYYYTLDQGYFESPGYTTPISTSYTNQQPITMAWNYDASRYRLKLDKINFNTGNSAKCLYSFSYSNMPLPERVYGARDKRGFASSSTIPFYTPPGNSGENFMVPSFVWPTNSSNTVGLNANIPTVDYTKACALEKLINSEKGEIDIAYSTPGYDFGGLAIDKLTYYDGYNHDNDLVKKYTYLSPVGLPCYIPVYNRMQQEDINNGFTWYEIHTNSIVELNSALNGIGHGWENVVEKLEDRNGNQISKTVSQYSGLSSYSEINNGNDDNYFTSGAAFNTIPYTNKQYLRAWGIGLPLFIKQYDQNNVVISNKAFKYSVTTDTKSGSDYKSVAKLASKINYLNRASDFYSDDYYPSTGTALLTESTEQNIIDNSRSFSVTTSYIYDSKNNLVSQTITNSSGDQVTNYNFYNYNWTGNVGTAMSQQNADGVQALVYSTKVRGGKEIPSSVSTLGLFNGYLRINNMYAPVNASAPTYNNMISGSDMFAMSLGNAPSNYRKVSQLTKYDDRGYLLEQTTLGRMESEIWDNESGVELASAKNAAYSEIAYCGFESNYYDNGITDYKKGNWDFDKQFVSSQYSFLGRKSFLLGSGYGMWTTGILSIGKQYVFTLWAKDAASFGASNGSTNLTFQNVFTINGWTLYKTEFTASNNGVSLWGSGYVDELKICPKNSIMTTHNYLPLVGKTSDVDENNRVTYYEYDNMGNLSIIRDHYKNITTKIKTVTQGN